MKIFSSSQIKQWDIATINELGISSLELMENAAIACVSWLKARFQKEEHFYIFCGGGNNGGDGLAITRLLLEAGFPAQAFLLPNPPLSIDTTQNVERLKTAFPETLFVVDEHIDINRISPKAILIDAIFGTGLNRPLDGLTQKVVAQINSLPNKKIAIDIPSGLFTDKLQGSNDTCFFADCTLSFQSYKRSFFFPEAAKYTGIIHILDIGLSEEFCLKNETSFFALDKNIVSSKYRPRKPFSHKGTFGTAVIVGGSYGKIGAIILSAKAALRAGAGKVFVQAPDCGYCAVQTSVPEAMFMNVGENIVDSIELMNGVVMGIGPGLGMELPSRIALESFLKNNICPVVIDADGLNIISKNKEKLLPFIPKGSIITPHPKEFERLFGSTKDSIERSELAMAKAKEYSIYIVLKGHHTAICTPTGECYFNLNGNAGMATPGSGDVLTGIITGLLAQSYAPKDAALLGVYLHGLSGDIAAKKKSQESLIAGDIIKFLGKAFLKIATK